MNPAFHGQLIFDKEAKIIQWGKEQLVVSTKGGGTPGYQHAINEVGEKNSSVSSQIRCLTPYTKLTQSGSQIKM